ncbi:MAG: tetratricopeptide repeat protein [Pyrinomonadaceae bacterium]
MKLCPDLAQAHLDYGRLLADKGEYPKAVASYRRVTELSPEEASVHFLLANVYRKMGLTAEADAEAKIVHEMNQEAQRARESRLGGSTARPQP